MEELNPKVYVITNIASALGQAIALGLANTGATVIGVARADSNGEEIVRNIARITQNPNVELQLSDLSNLSSIRNLAEIINSKFDKLDALINNHSIFKKQRSVTVDGFEEMFAGNYLGPFLLTNLLLDRLQASGSARIVTLTVPTTGQLDFDDLQSENGFNPIRAFNATRAANLLFTYELARRLQNSGVMVNALYPGLVRSEILDVASLPVRLFAWMFAMAPDRAARWIVDAVTQPEYQNMHGRFLKKGLEIQPSEYVLDTANQQRLWEISEDLTDARYLGPNYDPTGSIALYNDKEIPPGLIRPVEDPTIEENGVVKREQKG